MIALKNSQQLAAMRVAGEITGSALATAGETIKVGVTTKHIDDVIRRYIEKCGAKPSFLGYGGFPGSACISINDEVIHGIPSHDKVLHDGDIVKIDVGAYYNGFHGDSAKTFPVGNISDDAKNLIEATKKSFELGVEEIKSSFESGSGSVRVDSVRVGDVGAAIDEYVRSCGYSVVRKYIGHGVGAQLHEQPDVPNFGTRGRGVRIVKGMVIAIEPMVNIGGYEVRELKDKWTVVTADGSLSAHYEHTVAVTENGVELLTKID